MSDAFELFWRTSELTPATAPALAARLGAPAPPDVPRVCTFPAAGVPLARPRDGLARLLDRRRSTRSFAPGTLGARRLGHLLAGLAERPDGTRSYPSGGALYPLEVLCLAGDVDGGLGRSVLCYNPDDHTVTPVGPLPPWPAWSPLLNLAVTGEPQVVLVFVLFLERVLERYGDLGGRLALVEVGHAAHNVALRLAADGLAGCEAGGVVESGLLRLVGLEGCGGRVPLAYACGLAAATPSRRA